MTRRRFDKLLVLDLDETLLYASDEPEAFAYAGPDDFIVGPYLVRPRPGVQAFLQTCLEWFEVAVWTASTLDYANPCIERLVAPSRLEFVWGRERCTWSVDRETREGVFLKDLKKLRKRGYSLARVVFVDDTPEKLQRSYGNLVIMPPFTGDPDDRELARLLAYLERLGPVEDVRSIEKRGWRASV